MIWAFLTAIVIFVGPFLLAKLIARLLRLKDISVRLGIVLLAATLGLTPFAAQWVLGIEEQREYEAALAEWQQKLEERQSNLKITDAGLQRLQQARPEVQILRGGEGGDEGQLVAPAGGPAAAARSAPGAPDAREPAVETPAEDAPATGTSGAGAAADDSDVGAPPAAPNPDESR